MGSEGLHTALVAQTAGVGNGPVAANDGDTAMSQTNQRIHGAARGLPVVGGDAGQVVKGQHGGVVGDHDTGNVNAPEIPDKVLVVAAQEQNAQGLFFPAQLHGSAHLVCILVHIIHRQLVAGMGDQRLDGLHHLPEQLVADTLDHHQNGGGMKLLELLGVDVQLKAAFGGGLQNCLSRPLADVGMIVQRPGNGADGIAGLGGQVFDGHGVRLLSLFGILEMPTG